MKQKRNRQQQLDKKEFESELMRGLRSQEMAKEFEAKTNSDYHPLGLAAVHFFGNLAFGYIFFFVVRWIAGKTIGYASPEILSGIYTIMHVLIWGFAIIGVITRKSPWDRLFR
mgnify:CR=1 FL=1